ASVPMIADSAISTIHTIGVKPPGPRAGGGGGGAASFGASYLPDTGVGNWPPAGGVQRCCWLARFGNGTVGPLFTAAAAGVGSALIARRIAQSTRSEIFGSISRGARKSLFDFFIHASSGPQPSNGIFPVTAMYSVAPSEYTSQRTSAFLALRNCSGAMKCGVP